MEHNLMQRIQDTVRRMPPLVRAQRTSRNDILANKRAMILNGIVIRIVRALLTIRSISMSCVLEAKGSKNPLSLRLLIKDRNREVSDLSSAGCL